jgi:aminobenzoyl-glutamate utilization protein B
MKKTIALLAFVTLLASNAWAGSKGNKTAKNAKNNVAIKYINEHFETYDKLQKAIWAEPELGFLETHSSGLLKQHLRENGFTIEEGVAGMPTAYVATFGSGKPVIGFLSEFDALPGLSQDTVPYRKPLIENGSGHGCGHNTLGVASTAAAVSLSKWLTANHLSGTIKIYGSPAEEGGAGKVYLVREGLFDGVDAVLDWHPSGVNAVSTNGGTAMVMVDYKFYGKAAHAAGNPWKGRSALDAVEAFDYMVNLLREHVPTSSRIHYVIPDGGFAPNVVPEYARVSYYIRSPKRDILNTLTEWIDSAAVGAAKGTQTRVEKEIVAGTYERLHNRTLSKVIQRNLEAVGGVKYDERERKLVEEVIRATGNPDSIISQAAKVQPLAEFPKEGSGGSSDVGDVSWVVPLASFGAATFAPGSPGHSWQNVAVDGTTIGTKGLLNASRVFALSAIELFTDAKLLQTVKDEFRQSVGPDFKYVPLLGDRKPALDYRVTK